MQPGVESYGPFDDFSAMSILQFDPVPCLRRLFSLDTASERA